MRFMWAVLVLLLALSAGTAQASGFFGPGGFMNPFGNYNGQDGQGGQGGSFRPEATETKLYSQPSARSIKSGEQLTLEYDLDLAQSDMEKISVIEQGATLNYTLLISEDEKGESFTPGESGSVSFSMNRQSNEHCVLTLQPQVTQNTLLRVSARLTFQDGSYLENESDTILVYVAAEIRSHMESQECNAGDTVHVQLRVLGPEGAWQMTCYRSYSFDGGVTWTREEKAVGGYTLNTHEREPNVTLKVPIAAGDNCMARLEWVVILPDGTEQQHITDPVRVQVGTVTL